MTIIDAKITDSPHLTFGYTNHEGKYAVRRAIPLRVEHRVSEWHGDQPHHIMVAWDIDRQAERDFLIEDMVPLGNLRKRFERIAADNDLIERLAISMRWAAQRDHLSHDNPNSVWADTDDKWKELYRDIAVTARDFMTAHFAGPAAENAPHNFGIEPPSPENPEVEPTPGEDSDVAHSQPSHRQSFEDFAKKYVDDQLGVIVDNIFDRVFGGRNQTPERVQELLEANTRYLEDMREARRTVGTAILLADTWRSHGNELAADILRGVLNGNIDPRSDMVKHSAPGAARCVGPIEEGLRSTAAIIASIRDHREGKPDDEWLDSHLAHVHDQVRSLLKHNFPNPDAQAAEPRVEPEYRDQREPGEFGDGMRA